MDWHSIDKAVMHRDKALRILSLYFYPDIATTGQLLTELSVSLVEKGIAVSVITAQPTYVVRQVASQETYRGVSITRLWSTQFNKNSFAGKVFNSLTFFFSSLMYIITIRERSPLLIVSNPPFLPLIGVVANILLHVKFIFLVHDVYPDIAVRLHYLTSNGIIHRLWDAINALILRKATSIIVLSSTMRRSIERKITPASVFSPRITIIHNWADGNFIKPIARDHNDFVLEHHLERKFVVQYSGNHGLFHKLETLILAAERCTDPDVVFQFIGDGGKKSTLMEMARMRKLTNTMFLPYQKYECLPQSLTAASVAIVTLEENIEGLAMPSKLYSIMASGTPVIALCDRDSSVAEIIRDAQCGFVLLQDDVDGLLSAIEGLKRDPAVRSEYANRARSYFDARFSLPHAVEQYLKEIQFVLS